MRRSASVHLELRLSGRTNMVFSIAPAVGADIASELIAFSIDGQPLASRELLDLHGGRLHTFVTDAGTMAVDYTVDVTGRAPAPVVEERDWITYLRPSRYAQSDSLTPMARSEFRGLTGYAAIQAVTDWVFEHLRYAPGSSTSTDGALDTLLKRRGVCRDFSH